MRKTLMVFGIALTLVACSTEGLINTAFPDRERYAFRSQDGETIMQYACEPKGSDAASKTNAKRAHAYFDGEMTKLVDGIVADMLDGSGVSARELDARTEAGAERIVNTTEARYQCLFYETRDV